MTRRDRFLAALRGQPTDRPSIGLWQHYPGREHNGGSLAAAHIAFQQAYDPDFIKVTPVGTSFMWDWGTRSGDRVDAYGVPNTERFGLTDPNGLRSLKPLDPSVGRLAQECEVLRAIGREFGASVPFVQTVFTPLTNARKLAGDVAVETLRTRPADLEAALEVITETTVAYIGAIMASGAVGIFLATQCASYDVLSIEEHRRFCDPYDLRVLQAIRDAGGVCILHLHGHNVMFDVASRYPVDAVNWHDRSGAPSLAEARRLTGACLVGGLDDSVGFFGKPNAGPIKAQVIDAVRSAGASGLIIGPGCVLPQSAPADNLHAARSAVDEIPQA
jgi:uroporphyrinogen decarboxylase